MSKVVRKRAQFKDDFKRVNTPEKAKTIGQKNRTSRVLDTMPVPVLGWSKPK